MCFKAQRTLAFVCVVKSDGHSGLGDTSLPVFVDQVLEVGGSNLSSGTTNLLARVHKHSHNAYNAFEKDP